MIGSATLLKALSPTDVILDGSSAAPIITTLNPVHPLNAEAPIVNTLAGINNCVNDALLQPLKALSSMVVIVDVAVKVIVSILVHPLKAN